MKQHEIQLDSRITAFKKNQNTAKKPNKMETEENPTIDVGALKLLAYYLSGLKEGKGNLLPLGVNVIDELFNAIRYIENQRK